jgi:serine protease Do
VNSIEDLLHGGVDRDYWLGLRANDLRGQLWKMLGLAENRGAIVTGVDQGSPAAEADIRTDDVILQINDRQIDCASDARDYINNTDLRVGDHMTIVVSRHGKILTKQMKLIPIPRVKSYSNR